ncbi:hypothetical protein DOTSEDRAFT_172765 [Dothistroma septosporum NZE10]|uniref:L-ornithine N(5)-monooxygenase [NAD(P)H] n=1 Tax=Dothistroma septosporum (strain NZE10 / CBS 128990) TaxID=675120 RepID=N1PNL4_DOTSN|nr:hypothetical protein DOTSEDRAFT_172765 [Dothistroma septosporum NZE10]
MPSSRVDTLSSTREHTLPFVYDVLIVGAGPCGLAVAARLREQTPSALFTDEEHHRYHWINKHGGYAWISSPKTENQRRSQRSASEPSILVLDSSGDGWMAKWKRLFSQLEISHLRSPMFFHPDPHDRDGLLAYAHSQGRNCECLEITGCVGKELSKHQMKKKKKRSSRNDGEQAKPPVTIDERDRKDYFTPPSDLFQNYCDFIAKRYDLLDTNLIQKAAVDEIDYDLVPRLSAEKKLFTIRAEEQTYFAQSVVLAVGAGNPPSIPRPFPQSGCACACHAFTGQDEGLSARLTAGRPTNVLVIGGGLTSAQIADQAIRRGATRVFHVMRGPMRVKPFDVDLSWMGKFRNHEKATFWSADTDEERSDLIRSARGGGSITPRSVKILEKHVRLGKLSIHAHTTVEQTSHDPITQTWSIKTSPPVTDLPAIHFVYFATGVQSDVEKLPYLQKFADKYPMKCFDGMPALTDDLMWKPDMPLFMTGLFAALRVGPGAANLEGARVGAERIAWGLRDVLADEAVSTDEGRPSEASQGQRGCRLAAGISSRYESLEVE